MATGAWQRPTTKKFLANPVPYLEELYDKLASEIYDPVWRLQGTAVVGSGLTTLAVALDIDRAPFQVLATPSWATTVWVTAKALTGFTLNFGTAPGADAPVDFLVIQSEAGVV